MTVTSPARSSFEADVLDGLTQTQKQLPARYFYDEVGSALFEVITRLPEYGLTRADERLLTRHANAIAEATPGRVAVAELGSGSGTKTALVLRAIAAEARLVRYCPIDISQSALDFCAQMLASYGPVQPVLADYLDGLATATDERRDERVLLLFLGSTIGNFDRAEVPVFFREIRRKLRTGDSFLLGADLVKPEEVLLAAYDDPLGVTAAFNLNVLRRVNAECGGEFDLRAFAHQARWNRNLRRIEMHLASRVAQSVAVRGLGLTLKFREGETIWTESSYKFTVAELEGFARASGFEPVVTWTDEQWPFAESLWQAA
jgi:L-histidine Nalpha-methyltransferase